MEVQVERAQAFVTAAFVTAVVARDETELAGVASTDEVQDLVQAFVTVAVDRAGMVSGEVAIVAAHAHTVVSAVADPPEAVEPLAEGIEAVGLPGAVAVPSMVVVLVGAVVDTGAAGARLVTP